MQSYAVRERESMRLIAPDHPEQFFVEYSQHFAPLNPFHALASSQFPAGKVYTQDQLVPQRELVGTEYYEDFLLQWGTESGIGMALSDRPYIRSTLFLQCTRREFEAKNARWLRIFGALSPHLVRAIRYVEQAANNQILSDSLGIALDCMDQYVFIVNRRGEVLNCNALAKAVTEEGRSIGLDRAGRLVLRDAATQQQLKVALSAACNVGRAAEHIGGEFPLRDQYGVLAYAVRVTPCVLPATYDSLISPDASIGIGFATVIISKLRPATSADAGVAAEILGISKAESKVVIALLNGQTLSNYAAATGHSIHTVRTQLKSAMLKVGVTKQAALVAIAGRALAVRPR